MSSYASKAAASPGRSFADIREIQGIRVTAATSIVVGSKRKGMTAAQTFAGKLTPLSLLVPDVPFDLEVQHPETTPHFTVALPTPLLETDPKILALACNRLITTFRSTIPNIDEYRLSYVPQVNELRLKIPPIAWYDRVLSNSNRVETGLKWIKSIKYPKHQSDSENHHDPRGQFIEVQLPEACKKGVGCSFWLNNEPDHQPRNNQRGKNQVPAYKTCDRVHYWNTCASLIQQRDQDRVPCNFRIPDELVISQKLDSRFVLLGRQDELRSRDILFVPKPAPPWPFAPSTNPTTFSADIHPDDSSGHYENESFVQSPDVWNFVQTVIRQILEDASVLPKDISTIFTEVAFNFGTWETKLNKDMLALECHAHGHLLLTSEGQSKLLKHQTYRAVMAGRHAPPFPYDQKDADILESTRVAGDLIDQLRQEQANTANVLTEMQGTMKLILTKLESIKLS